MNKFYTTITELPFYNFIEASVTGNLKHLIIEGAPTEKELQEAWHEIQSEYAEAIGDNEQQYALKLVKELAILEANYSTVHILVETLRKCYVEVFAKQLNKLLHTLFRFDITQLDQYDKNLDHCLTRAKAFKIDHERKSLELQALMQKRGGEGKKPTREYYLSLWNSIRMHHKLSMDVRQITTFDFCDFLQRTLKEANNNARG